MGVACVLPDGAVMARFLASFQYLNVKIVSSLKTKQMYIGLGTLIVVVIIILILRRS